MNTLTRQDVVTATEGAKNKIIERLVTRYDVQTACDNARDRIISNLNATHLEQQTLLRQSNAQKDQVWRRTMALEQQVVLLQQEIRSMHQLINRVYEQEITRL